MVTKIQVLISMHCVLIEMHLIKANITEHIATEHITEHPITKYDTDHPITERITDHPITERTTDHPITERITDNPITKHITDHRITGRTTDHPITERITDHPITERTTDHPITERITDHPITKHITDHRITIRTTDYPIRERITDHPITERTTDHPTTERITDHPITERITDHPITERTTDHPTTERITDHPITKRITDYPITERITDHSREHTDHPITRYFTNNPFTKHFTDHLITELILEQKSFSMRHFLNMTDEEESWSMYGKFHLCPQSGQCGCSCEVNCMKEKRCCINAFWNSSFISRQDEYIRYFLALSRQYKDQECSYTIPKRFVKVEGDIEAYYMVTNCQDNTVANVIKDKCIMGNFVGSSIEYYIPVKDNENYLYRNKYCAMCNSVSEFKMVRVIHGCRKYYGYYGVRNKCKIKLFDATHTTCRYGSTDVAKTCSRDNQYYDLCRAFIGPVGSYANYFCYLCNGGSPSVYPRVPWCPPVPPDGGFSWSTLLKLDYSDKKDVKCKTLEVLDGKSQKCSPFVCPIGYKAKNSKCLALKKNSTRPILSIKDASFDICLQSRQPRIFLKGFLNYSAALRKLFPTYQESRNPFVTVPRRNVSSKLLQLVASGNNMKLVDGLEPNKSLEIMKSIEHKIEDYIKENETIILAVTNPLNNSLSKSKIFPNNLICADPILIKLFFNFTYKCDGIVDGERIPFSNISLVLEINKKGFARNAYTCKKFYLSKPCPRKILNENYTTMNNDSSIVYTEGEVKSIFHAHEYEPYSDGSFTVCIESNTDEIGPWWFSTVNEIAIYVSIVGSSCSVVCYILLTFTILHFKELRNVPGLCTLALSINLLIGDVLFLTSNLMHRLESFKPMNTLCDVIGVLIHFFLLSAQIWGLVMAIDISINLTKSIVTRQNNKRKLIWFNVIPVVFSAVLITIALLFRDKDILDVSYNKNGMCILHGYYSRMFLFYSPLLICFFVSSIMLSLSIGYISKERRQRNTILKGGVQNKTSIVKVSLKLVVLCGTVEGVGIINIPTGRNSSNGIYVFNSILILLYSLLKAFRGVMMFIVYVCRKPIYEKYRCSKSDPTQGKTNSNAINNNDTHSRNNRSYKDSQL